MTTTNLLELMSAQPLDLPAIAAALDALPQDARLQAVTAFTRRQQAALYEAAAGFRPLTLEDLVPSSLPPLCEVVHEGKNSLPAFTRFAKVFCRPDGGGAGELWGYNRTQPLVATTVGPGYSIARSHDVVGELLVDYLRVPPRKPQSWPEILPNSARLSRLVYYQTQDILRGVSRHVSIGRATKGGKDMSAWFVLCRQE